MIGLKKYKDITVFFPQKQNDNGSSQTIFRAYTGTINSFYEKM